MAIEIAKKFKKSGVFVPLLHITIAWIVSNIIMGIVYPQLLVYHQISHIRFLDPERVYMGFFTFLSNMYHGGIQLWNPYDQMPLMFSYMIGDIIPVNQLFGALFYPIVSLFYDSSGEAFHVTASIVLFLASSLLQITGIYLLLRRFSSRLIVLLPCIIIGGTLLSPSIYFGTNFGSLFCLFPLLLHFILRFFEDFRLNDALLAFVVMLVGVGTSPYTALGYLYQCVHYFILCALVWSMVRRDSILRKCFKRETWRPKRSTFVKIGITLVLFVMVMAPWFIMVSGNYDDYEFGHKGSRMENMSSITEYFKRPVFFANRESFLPRSLDYGTNHMAGSWHFLGFSTLFLSLCGLILNRDSRKFVFFGAILFLWAINSPHRISTDVGFLAHVINALTNPTKALVRSYHMGVFLMPYFFVPLIAMGLESLFSIAGRCRANVFADEEEQKTGMVKSEAFKNVSGLLIYCLTTAAVIGAGLFFLLNRYPAFFEHYSIEAMVIVAACIILILSVLLRMMFCNSNNTIEDRKLQIVSVVILAMASMVSMYGLKFVTMYLLISVFISFILLIILVRTRAFRYRMPLIALLLLMLFAIDATCLNKWMEIYSSNIMMEKLTVPGLERFGKVVLDYQNPKVLPFREYYNNGTAGQIPHWFGVNSYNMQGLFYRYTNLGKFKVPGDSKTTMHHVSFDPLHQKRSLQVYLERDQRIFFQAQLAVKDGPDVFDKILQHGLDRTIIVIDHDSPAQGPYASSLPDPVPQPLEPPRRKFNTFSMMISDADTTYEGELALYWFDLPEGFAKHLATSIYTLDSNLLGVKINNKEFIPAQGKLVSPYTFDVQNIAEGKLVVALPRDRKRGHNESIVFTYPMQNETGITRVRRYEPDTLELDYVAEKDGWFVMHYPFDKKWKVAVDGKPAQVYKANYCFMSVPVSKGEHRILLQYWPDTHLRFFLGLSYLMALLSLVTVIFIGIKSEAKRHC